MSKKVYTDKLKSIGKKVCFSAAFTDVPRRGALPEETSIHTAEMTAIKIPLREIHKREDKR